MLKVIGAGFGRTGTLSTKMALERLGFGPCYHMLEVVRQPSDASVWRAAAARRPVDWEALLRGYASTIDWPASYFWSLLMERYPSSRILLTVRDPDDWYDSMARTILATLLAPSPPDRSGTRDRREMARNIILDRVFGGLAGNRDHAIAVFKAHNQRVVDTVPPDRLLVYRVTEGWAPLCEFLGCPVPDEAFPKKNSRAEFKTQFNVSDQ